MKKINKLSLPITIIIASIILGSFLYAIQINKQRSIERQQEIKNVLDELKLKQDECEALSSGLTKKWNNIIGATYDNNIWKECVVTYIDAKTGEIETSRLKFMKEN